jgi:hypothetical protein
MADEKTEVKLPNHMTAEELIASGKSPEQAKKIMSDRVFGVDHKVDEAGKPIEQGIGSAANPFKSTHEAALKKAQEANARLGLGASPEVIASIVAAVMSAMEAKSAAKDL